PRSGARPQPHPRHTHPRPRVVPGHLAPLARPRHLRPAAAHRPAATHRRGGLTTSVPPDRPQLSPSDGSAPPSPQAARRAERAALDGKPTDATPTLRVDTGGLRAPITSDCSFLAERKRALKLSAARSRRRGLASISARAF